ncbi:uncharacterized protein LOC118419736 [Branchiostoma floridae]|uniref:Uncharacterized protein LOC118419736 n=1 Tax=Branchiostoma floridae TaxID=7739 RepID=A0A9J7MXA0_BRAFL|nr:uncharacterized protein LOC118419736 [Branchiostoma floridae]
MFKKLIGADPELAWKLAGSMMVSELLGDHVVTVPTLENAHCFGPATVLVKAPQTFTDKATHRHGSFHAVGRLYDLCVCLPQCIKFGLVPQTDTIWKKPKPGKTLSVGHRSLRQPLIEKKKIHMEVRDVVKKTIFLDLKEKVQLRDDNEEISTATSVYIITEVFYATGLDVQVTVDGRKGAFSTDTDIPIAFRYQKYKLEDDGAIGDGLDSNIKKNRTSRLLVKTAYVERLNSIMRSEAQNLVVGWKTPPPVVAEVLPGMVDDKMTSSKPRGAGGQAWACPTEGTAHVSCDVGKPKLTVTTEPCCFCF